MSPAPRAEPVGTREEVRLEDRLQHQFQGCLDHPVADGGDPQPATFRRAGLRDHPFPYRQRLETAVLNLGPQLVEEFLDSHIGLHVVDTLPVHSGRARTLVAPYPIPGHQQESGVGDEVEQIIEPAVRIIYCPSVQLGLDLQYPALCRQQSLLRFVGIHRRSSWPSRTSAADLLAPFALRPAFPTSMAGRYARDYYGASALPGVHSGQRACPFPYWLHETRATPDSSHVHHLTDRRAGRPALLLRHRHDYAVGIRRGLLPGGIIPARSSRPTPTPDGAHRNPAHIRQI